MSRALALIDRGAHVPGASDDVPDAEDDPALRVLGPHGRLLAEAVALADTDDPASRDPDRLALFVATDVIDPEPHEILPALCASRTPDGRFDPGRFFAGGYRLLHPLWPLAQLANVAVGQIAIDRTIRGENAVFASDADAGVRAVLEGGWCIAEGRADGALVAGSAPRSGAFARGRAFVEGLPSSRRLGTGAAAIRLLPDGASDRPRRRRLLGGTTGNASGRADEAWHELVVRAVSRAGVAPDELVEIVAVEDPALDAALEALGAGAIPRCDHEKSTGFLGPAGPIAWLASLVANDAIAPGVRLALFTAADGGRGALLAEVA